MRYRPCQCPLFLHILGPPALPGGTDPTSPRHDRHKNPSWDGKYTTCMKIHKEDGQSWPHAAWVPLAPPSTGSRHHVGTAHGAQRQQIHLRTWKSFPWGGGLLGRWCRSSSGCWLHGVFSLWKLIELYKDDRCTFLYGYYILRNVLESLPSEIRPELEGEVTNNLY